MGHTPRYPLRGVKRVAGRGRVAEDGQRDAGLKAGTVLFFLFLFCFLYCGPQHTVQADVELLDYLVPGDTPEHWDFAGYKVLRGCELQLLLYWRDRWFILQTAVPRHPQPQNNRQNVGFPRCCGKITVSPASPSHRLSGSGSDYSKTVATHVAQTNRSGPVD